MVPGPSLDLSGYQLATSVPSRLVRSASVELSLKAAAAPGSDILVSYAIGGGTFTELGTVDLNQGFSNALHGGYGSIPLQLPRSVIKHLSLLTIRIQYRTPDGQLIPAGSSLLVDGAGISVSYASTGDDSESDDDILAKQRQLLDPEGFLSMDFETDITSVSVPGDPSKPFTIGRSIAGKNIPLKMTLVGSDAAALGRRVTATSGSSTIAQVVYENVFDSTDVTYDVTESGLKETLILKDDQHPTSFRYLLNLSDFDAVQTSPSRIILYTKGHSGQQLFRRYTLSAPFMQDSAGRRSEELSFKLKGNLLTLIPDEAFLEDASYPVAIDPNVEVTVLNLHSHPQAGDDWTVDFTTVGTADLKITPADQATIDEDQFTSLFCGSEDRTAQATVNPTTHEISFPGWSCDNEVATVVHKTLVTGHHHLTFDFGGIQAEAFNAAVSWDGGAGTSNWFDALNWSNDLVPTAADDVVISSNVTVNYNTTVAYTVLSLTLGNSGGGTTPILNFTGDNIGSGTPLTLTNVFTYSHV
jgi:hypothetical protein